MAKKTAGPGRKECPECHKIIAARSTKCECGHLFVPKATGGAKVDLSYFGPEVAAAIALIQICGGVEKAEGMLKTTAHFLKVATEAVAPKPAE